jgi:hypothetical protein
LEFAPSVVTKVAAGMEDPQSEKTRLDAIRAKREYLIQQIRESEPTIEQSRELIKRLDELLAKGGSRP